MARASRLTLEGSTENVVIKKRDTVLRGRERDFRGLKARFRKAREARAGEIRRIVGDTPMVTFQEAEEAALIENLKGCTDEQFLELLEEYQDVDPVARRLLKKIVS